jgi:hypothetical protein
MNKIYAIVTHHERPDAGAEAWKECNVCAIGFHSDKKLTKMKDAALAADARTFLKMEKGDVILAYTWGNRIAYVGEVVDGKYTYTTENLVGRSEEQGGFGYPHQYKVKWWDKPYDFSRKDLPEFLRDQLGKRGRTVIPIVLGRRSFDQVKQIIITNAESGSLSYDVNEDMIKAGMRKYLRRHLNSLEKGLKITGAEASISESGRPDFIAKDEKGKTVLIECKGFAYPADLEQLERYGKDFAKEKPRLMLVAFKMADECVKLAKKNPKIELFECDLTFSKRNAS